MIFVWIVFVCDVSFIIQLLGALIIHTYIHTYNAALLLYQKDKPQNKNKEEAEKLTSSICCSAKTYLARESSL